MRICPVVSVIVPVTPGAKTMMFGSGARFACAIAARRLPAPLSFVFVTVRTADTATVARPMAGRVTGRARGDRRGSGATPVAMGSAAGNVAPAATNTDAGTVTTPASLFDKFTVNPPAGAGVVSTTANACDCPGVSDTLPTTIALLVT